MQFTSSRRGARLARLLAVRRLDTWGHPRGGPVSLKVETVVAELCANAVLHGRVPGRDFHLAMRLRVDGVIRVEVSDARRERVPVLGQPWPADEESGRGLLLVEALAERWGVAERRGVGKTVWCEVKA
ncbi:ATP-binding protein [Streptomyces synnematoformans]|uniref:Histidine kinase/HSP90-like ATPase domain-containing protein n=1 Tax=Streptomyces synnematoformans TaxID=415721 RepID=A0ABN2YPJ1_9ACTN